MSTPFKRRDTDITKLMMKDFNVELINDGTSEVHVEFHGPKESLYEGGVWKIRVVLPNDYPLKSPSIGFLNKIYHPNIEEMSGSVCLDVLDQEWRPIYDLVNVFEIFLPQLLLYPNPSDPFNRNAASLLLTDQKQYEEKVREYCKRYAKKEEKTEASEEEISTDGSSDKRSVSSDDDAAGHADT